MQAMLLSVATSDQNMSIVLFTYLKADAATANSEATRAVVEEIADREYELHRADLVDGESERGETH